MSVSSARSSQSSTPLSRLYERRPQVTVATTSRQQNTEASGQLEGLRPNFGWPPASFDRAGMPALEQQGQRVEQQTYIPRGYPQTAPYVPAPVLEQQGQRVEQRVEHSSRGYPQAAPYMPVQSDTTILVHHITQHFDGSVSRLFDALTARMNRHDELVIGQQKQLNSLADKIAESQDKNSEKVLRDVESLRIDLEGNHKTVQKLKAVIPAAMSRFRAEIMRDLGIEFSNVRERLSGIEESIAMVREEMNDPDASLDPVVSHEVGVGTSTPSTPSHCHTYTLRRVPVEPRLVGDDMLDQGNAQDSWPGSPSLSRDQDKLGEGPNAHMDAYLDIDLAEDGGQRWQDREETASIAVNPVTTLPNPVISASTTPQAISSGSGTRLSELPQQTPYDDTEDNDLANVDQLGAREEIHELPVHLFPRVRRVQNAISSSSSSVSSLPEPHALFDEIFTQRKAKVEEMEPEAQLSIRNSPPPGEDNLVPLAQKPVSGWSATSLSTLTSLNDSTSDIESDVEVNNLLAPPKGTRLRPRNSKPIASFTPLKRANSDTVSSKQGNTKRRKEEFQYRTSKQIKKDLVNDGILLTPSKRRSTRTSPVKVKDIWPKKVYEKKGKAHQFVQCDKCQSWYHWGCVGIRENDHRLNEGVEFLCPPCAFPDSNILPKSVVEKGQNEICSRPDCHRIVNATEEFFIVERFVGRFDHGEGKGLDRYDWLVKWDGYDIDSCLWLPGGELANDIKHAERFEIAAKAEGVFKSGQAMVLLKEAKDAGWDQEPTKSWDPRRKVISVLPLSN